MEETQLQRYRRRFAALKNERSSWEPHWRDLADFVLPRRTRFLQSRRNRGERKNDKIIDNTATMALRVLSSGMMSGITSPARPWFRLTTSDRDLDEDSGVKRWLFSVEQEMRALFVKSNLYNVLPNLYTDMGLFGVGAMAVMEDPDEIMRCYSFPVGSYALATSDRLVVDTMYRELSMTVAQLVQRFGVEAVSEGVRSAFERKQFDQWVEVIHLIEPNLERKPDMMDNRNMEWRSVWFEANAAENKVLRESGFNEFPILAPRWEVTGEDIYSSNCPGMLGFGDIRALQLEQRRKLEAIDKLVNPPMVAPTSLKNQYSSLLPGDVTYVDSTQPQGGFRPVYEINPRINELGQDIYETQQRINRAFFVDLFQMLAQSDRRQITAREIEERHEEKLLMLGPVLQRLNDELLDPLIDRTFAIMLRRGLIPEPPQELEGMDLSVEYISIMAQAQQLVGTASIERMLGFAGNLVAVNPDIVDKIDFDQTMDEYAEMLGVPPTIIRSDEAVAGMRQAKQQQEQAMQAAAAAQSALPAAQAAKVLSETDVDRESALSRISAGMGGG